MKTNIDEVFDLNLSLEVLYDVLESLYEKYNNNYPIEINDMIKNILKEIEKYNYHEKKGYSIVGEKYYSQITYKTVK